MKTKRLLSFALALIMLACLLPGSAHAVGGYCGENARWEYDDGVLTVTGSGAMEDYSDPYSTPWADYSYHITRVRVSGITSIGDFAFEGFYNLQSVTLGEGLERIGDGAFFDCMVLEAVSFPSTLRSIGEFAFSSDYSVKEIVIPASVTYIGVGAFSEMSALESITVEQGSGSFASAGGALYNKTVTELMACPAGKTGSFIMPSTVTSIGDYALYGCHISALNMPSSLTSIGEKAFSLCRELTRITIPGNVTSIGDSAFTECTSLTGITVMYSNSRYRSSDGILYSYDMKRLVCYPMGKSGGRFTIADSVTELNPYAFAYSKITHITLGKSTVSVGDHAFLLCEELESVDFGESLRTVGDFAFSDCVKLNNITLPDTVERIGTGAFGWCENLVKVRFLSPVYISGYAFAWCTNLKRVEFTTDAPEDIGEDAFYACEDACIYFPYGASGWTAPDWHNYLSAPFNPDGGTNPTPGDIDSNGVIDNSDLVQLARYVVGLTLIDLEPADLNGDDSVNNADLVMLARTIVGMN